MNTEKQRLLGIIRDLYGRVCWSHKTHEKERELSTQKAVRYRQLNAILMALTTTGVVASIPLGSTFVTILAALLAAISTTFAIYQLSFSAEIEIYQQRQAAKSLLLERERIVLLIERAMAEHTDADVIRKDLENLVERLGQIYSSSPDTTSKAYKMASDGLKINEELTFSDNEIDALLPEELRRNISP